MQFAYAMKLLSTRWNSARDANTRAQCGGDGVTMRWGGEGVMRRWIADEGVWR